MRRHFLILFALIVLAGCGGSGSLTAPTGAVITLTPTAEPPETLKITSTSTVQKSIVQLYQVSVKDSPLPGAKGVRDTIFNVTFELTNVPGTATADLSSLVTLCDGSQLINTTAEKQTDNQGIYNLCVVFRTGGGLNYTGNLRVLSGGVEPAATAIDVASTTPELAVSPAQLTVRAGSNGQFTVTGGSPEYTITTSDPAVLPVPSSIAASGGAFFAAVPGGTPAGTAVVFTIRDAANASTVATLTVGEPQPPTVLPSAPTVTAGSTVRFTIIGGVPDYSIFSNNSEVVPVPATVTANGGTFNVAIPATTTATTVSVTVRDSIGGSRDVSITIQAPLTLTIVPDSVSVNAGSTATFAVTGGVPGYTVVSNNAAVLPSPGTLAASGDTFRASVSPSMPTSTVTFTVVDSVGKTDTATLIVTGKSSQTISFGAAPVISVGNTGIVSATATSGLPVTFSSLTPSICTVSGTTVQGVAAGTCSIAANQAGNANYFAAPQVTQNIIVQ